MNKISSIFNSSSHGKKTTKIIILSKIFIFILISIWFIGYFSPFYNGADSKLYGVSAIDLANGEYGYSNTIKTMNVIKVPMKRIDSFLEEKKLDRLDFVRMDIEGFEIKLFEGFWNTIKKFKPIIQMEFHNYLFDKETKIKFFQKFKENGYEKCNFRIYF